MNRNPGSLDRTIFAALARPRPVWVAAVVGLLLVGYLGAVLVAHDGDPLTFVEVGTRFAGGEPNGTAGYDGQFAYYIALDPLSAPAHLDVPAYRWQRILHPMLARALAFGRPEWIPWTLVGVGLLGHIVGTWIVAQLVADAGATPWYALSYGLWVGFFYAVRLDLAEPLAYGLVAAALLAERRGRAGWSAALFGLALFAKETTLLFFAGQAAALAFRRRWRELAVHAAAGLPFLIFQLLLWRWLGQPGLTSGGDMATPFEWLPFMGLWRIGAVSLPALALYLVLFGPSIILPSLWGITASVRALLRRDWHPYHFALAANAGVVPFLPFSIFREPVGLVRLACGLVMAVVLFGAASGSKRVLRYAMFWTTMLVMLIKD